MIENYEELTKKLEILKENLKTAKNDFRTSKIEHYLIYLVLLIIGATCLGCAAFPVLNSPEISGFLLTIIVSSCFIGLGISIKPFKQLSEFNAEYKVTLNKESEEINNIKEQIEKVQRLISEKSSHCTLQDKQGENFYNLERREEIEPMIEPNYTEDYDLNIVDAKTTGISRIRKKNNIK